MDWWKVITPLMAMGLIFIGVYTVFIIARRRLNRFTRRTMNMGIGQLAKVISQGMAEESELPLALGNMEAVYIPMILKDFPEISIKSLHKQAENALLAYFNAVENKDVSKIIGGRNFINSTTKLIESNNDTVVEYENVHIHNSKIVGYKNTSKSAELNIDISLECIYYKLINGKMVEGNRDKKTQSVYRVIFVYNQDSYLEGSSVFISSNCPNCGAPVSAVGSEKYCSFCGTGLSEVSSRIWEIEDIIMTQKR